MAISVLRKKKLMPAHHHHHRLSREEDGDAVSRTSCQVVMKRERWGKAVRLLATASASAASRSLRSNRRRRGGKAGSSDSKSSSDYPDPSILKVSALLPQLLLRNTPKTHTHSQPQQRRPSPPPRPVRSLPHGLRRAVGAAARQRRRQRRG